MKCIACYSSFVCTLLLYVLAEVGIASGQRMFQFRHKKLLDNSPVGLDNSDDYIENSFIVVLDDQYLNTTTDVHSALQDLMVRENLEGKISRVYKNAFKGVVITGMPIKRMRAFLNNKMVKYATPNGRISVQKIKSNPSWLSSDRIKQRDFPLRNKNRYKSKGEGVIVYVFDTGIRLTHWDFVGRATCGFNYFNESESCDDFYGHGTHVAGLVGGRIHGVAKGVKIVTVKILDQFGDGSWEAVLQGIDYVMEQKKESPTTPMIINMSIGGKSNTALNDAIKAAVEAGIVVVGSAGNQFDDACNYSPGSSPYAISVGAIDYADELAAFSNFGNCVTLFAPGSLIVSSYIKSDIDTAVLSGTSMASPQVAGVAALYLGEEPNMEPKTVMSKLLQSALKDKIIGLEYTNSPNLLLNTDNP